MRNVVHVFELFYTPPPATTCPIPRRILPKFSLKNSFNTQIYSALYHMLNFANINSIFENNLYSVLNQNLKNQRPAILLSKFYLQNRYHHLRVLYPFDFITCVSSTLVSTQRFRIHLEFQETFVKNTEQNCLRHTCFCNLLTRRCIFTQRVKTFHGVFFLI